MKYFNSMLLLSDRSHGRLVMLQKNHGMIMESFPMVIMFHDKHSMACNGPWNGCDVETFQSVSVKVTLLKKTYEYKIRSLCCLFTDVTPLKEKFHSTRFSTKVSFLDAGLVRIVISDEGIQMRSHYSM